MNNLEKIYLWAESGTILFAVSEGDCAANSLFSN